MPGRGLRQWLDRVAVLLRALSSSTATATARGAASSRLPARSAATVGFMGPVGAGTLVPLVCAAVALTVAINVALPGSGSSAAVASSSVAGSAWPLWTIVTVVAATMAVAAAALMVRLYAAVQQQQREQRHSAAAMEALQDVVRRQQEEQHALRLALDELSASARDMRKQHDHVTARSAELQKELTELAERSLALRSHNSMLRREVELLSSQVARHLAGELPCAASLPPSSAGPALSSSSPSQPPTLPAPTAALSDTAGTVSASASAPAASSTSLAHSAAASFAPPSSAPPVASPVVSRSTTTSALDDAATLLATPSLLTDALAASSSTASCSGMPPDLELAAAAIEQPSTLVPTAMSDTGSSAAATTATVAAPPILEYLCPGESDFLTTGHSRQSSYDEELSDATLARMREAVRHGSHVVQFEGFDVAHGLSTASTSSASSSTSGSGASSDDENATRRRCTLVSVSGDIALQVPTERLADVARALCPVSSSSDSAPSLLQSTAVRPRLGLTLTRPGHTESDDDDDDDQDEAIARAADVHDELQVPMVAASEAMLPHKVVVLASAAVARADPKATAAEPGDARLSPSPSIDSASCLRGAVLDIEEATLTQTSGTLSRSRHNDAPTIIDAAGTMITVSTPDAPLSPTSHSAASSGSGIDATEHALVPAPAASNSMQDMLAVRRQSKDDLTPRHESESLIELTPRDDERCPAHQMGDSSACVDPTHHHYEHPQHDSHQHADSDDRDGDGDGDGDGDRDGDGDDDDLVFQHQFIVHPERQTRSFTWSTMELPSDPELELDVRDAQDGSGEPSPSAADVLLLEEGNKLDGDHDSQSIEPADATAGGSSDHSASSGRGSDERVRRRRSKSIGNRGRANYLRAEHRLSIRSPKRNYSCSDLWVGLGPKHSAATGASAGGAQWSNATQSSTTTATSASAVAAAAAGSSATTNGTDRPQLTSSWIKSTRVNQQQQRLAPLIESRGGTALQDDELEGWESDTGARKRLGGEIIELHVQLPFGGSTLLECFEDASVNDIKELLWNKLAVANSLETSNTKIAPIEQVRALVARAHPRTLLTNHSNVPSM